MTEKTWAIGIPAFITLTEVEGGAPHTYDVSFDFDPAEIGVAVAETASEFSDADELEDHERDVLEWFVEAVFAEKVRGNNLGGFTLRLEPTEYRVDLSTD